MEFILIILWICISYYKWNYGILRWVIKPYVCSITFIILKKLRLKLSLKFKIYRIWPINWNQCWNLIYNWVCLLTNIIYFIDWEDSESLRKEKTLKKLLTWLWFFERGRLWFMLFDSKLLILIDMPWMILWSSLCTWLCDCVIWLCGLWLVWNPETVEFIFSNPLYRSDAFNKEGLMKII